MRTPGKFKALLLPLLCAAPLAAGEINFVYPPEGSPIPDVPKTFVFGNISPATAPFTINGEKVQVYQNGGFIAYLPIAPGDFAFTGSLPDGTSAQRKLKVKGLVKSRTDDDDVWLALNSVSNNMEVLPGEYVKIQANGAPNMEAVYSIAGMAADQPMAEQPAGSGRYYGFYRVKPSDAGLEGAVSTRFLTGIFRSDAETQSKGVVKVLKGEYLVETSTDPVILRNAPDGGYMMFLPKGVKLVVNGRQNGLLRVALAPGETGWVDSSKVTALPETAAPAPPFTETSAIKTRKMPWGAQALVAMYDKVPYTVEETPNGVRLTLYYTSLHSNWIVYDSSDTLVKAVVFRQAGAGKAEIDFETSEPVWGYNVAFSPKGLLLDLRARPALQLAWPKPLAGLSVVLDPGHSPKYTPPYDGAVGPKKSFEFQVNMAIALKLQEKLLALGATVQLTRTGDANLALADRPKAAKDLGGDLFISVHNNAIGDGEDPWAQPRGFQVYYYHRHSLALAEAVHKAYVRNIPLPDEGLRYGDYLVARMTWMPAVLTESAYMIFPEQEEMLNSPVFQDKYAQSMAEGVLEFMKAPPPPAKKPAAAPKKEKAAEPAEKKAAAPARKPAPAPAPKKISPVSAKKVNNARQP